MIRVIASDVDGTLLASDKSIPDSTRTMLNEARAAGVIVLLASGRPIHGLRYQCERLGFEVDGYIGCNGGEMADARTGELRWTHPIDPAVTARFVDHARALPVSLVAPDGDRLYVEDIDAAFAKFLARSNDLGIEVVEDLAALQRPWPKLQVTANAPTLADSAPVLARVAAGLCDPFAAELLCEFSSPVLIEVNAPGADKGAALARYCHHAGIDMADTIAFGDNDNDHTMLRRAGVGVAMGNGSAAAKAAADIVTESHDHDGLALALRRYLDV